MLISANVITPLMSRRVNRKASAWLIGKAEVERLHVSPLVSKASFGKPVHGILKYGRLSASEAIALIKAVCDGELKSRALVEGTKPIGLAMVDSVEFKQWLSAKRAESLYGISVDQAAQVLGVKQQVAYDLVRRGF